MKYLKIFENWINESLGVLSKEDLDKNLEAFIKANPKTVATDKILPCGAVIKINDYTGIKTTESDFIFFSSTGEDEGVDGTIRITKESNGKIGIFFSLHSSNPYGIDRGEIFYIKFEDGSIMKFVTSGDNISYDHSVFIYPTASQLGILKTKKINGMKYDAEEAKVSEKTASIFINSLNCVISGKVIETPAAQTSPELPAPPGNTFSSRTDLIKNSIEKFPAVPKSPNPINITKK